MQNVDFVVTGMFRSGTTLLAKTLSAHDKVQCVSDPFSPFFKQYRNEFLSNDDSIALNSPLFDYVFDHSETKILHEMQKKSFDEVQVSSPVSELKNKIKAHCLPYAPKIIMELDRLDGHTYADLFSCFRTILKNTYGTAKQELIGFKEVWISELIPQILKTSSNVKVLIIVRDPRAVVSSNYSSKSIYPILFLLRQWRKIAGQALVAQSMFPDRVKILKYEELIIDSENTIKNLCEFLDITPDINMLDPQKFKDGNQNTWMQNSSHTFSKHRRSKFNTTGIDLWRAKLSEQTISFIEALCFFEMQKYGYSLDGKLEMGNIISLVRYNQDLGMLADWIKPYADKYDKLQVFNEHSRISYFNNIKKFRDPAADTFFGISSKIIDQIVQ